MVVSRALLTTSSSSSIADPHAANVTGALKWVHQPQSLMQEKEVMQTKRSAADLSAIQADGKARSVRMLAAYMDLGARYKMVGKQQRASAELRGLRIETRVTLGEEKVTAPCASISVTHPPRKTST